MTTMSIGLRDKSYFSYLQYRLLEKGISEVYLYGTGEWSKLLTTFFSYDGRISISGHIDDGFSLHPPTELRFPVFTSNQALSLHPNVVITSEAYQDEIFNRLINSGYEADKVFKIFVTPELDNADKYVLPPPKRINIGSINRVIFVGDNTDTPNFGCRATSTALIDILSLELTVTRRIKRGEILNMFSAIPIIDDLMLYIAAVKKFNSSEFENLIKVISQVDALVLNGEGSFIFKDPPRKDLHKYALIMLACIEAKKPFFVLNAMFSAYANEPMNELLSHDILSILESANVFCARDHVSFDLIKKGNYDIRVRYVPDALFTWTSVLDSNATILHEIAINSCFSMPFISPPELYDNLDLTIDYVLLGGNSYASHAGVRAEEAFVMLTLELMQSVSKHGLKLFLIECCEGDYFLRQVAAITNVPYIPVYINIYMASRILGESKCFISGRYHPSILASMGGTPCVFMGSNSHKTLSLQAVLGINQDECVMFQAIPCREDVNRIVNEFEKSLSRSRCEIKANCHANDDAAKGVWKTALSEYGGVIW